MIRACLALLCLLPLLAAPLAAARAQLPLGLGATGSSTTPTPTTQSATAITPEQASQALEVLNDPAKRAQIIATLQAIAHAQSVPAASATPSGALGFPLAPDSLAAAVLLGATNFLGEVANRVSDGVRAAQGFPLLRSFVMTMATDPVAHTLLIDLALRLAAALAVCFAVQWGITRVLHPTLLRICRRLIRLPPMVVSMILAAEAAEQQAEDEAESGETESGETESGAAESGEARAEHGEMEPPAPPHFDASRMLRRTPLVLAALALYLVPLVGFVVAGHVVVGSALGTTRLVRLILLAVIDSYALCAAVLFLARALLAPRHHRLRLLPVSSAGAGYAYRWTRRLLVIGVVGYAVAEVGLLLGLSEVAHLALLKATVFVLHICLGVIVVQKRRVVRGWIRAPAHAQGIVASVRNGLAGLWHWLALFYLASIWLVWVAALPAGYERLTRGLLLALAVALLARVCARTCIRGVDRLLHAGSALAVSYPGLDSRLSFYHPLLHSFVRVGVTLLGVLLFLQLLGFDTVEWLTTSPVGEHLSGSLIMLVITLLLALLGWEAANLTLERQLAHLTKQAQIAKLARLRTLLPILRTTLLVAVLTVTAMMVLSEIGVNTAPLLASAGIIGVAIGFGSQKLVQDLITGLFLLLENTMQVGDVVSLAGLSGVIEALSVRTIHLRAEDGSVHVIPFSSVTTVTNMTRDYGRAVIQVAVLYKEDVDHVIEVLQGITIEMRRDPQFKDVIQGDLEVYGLDQFTPAAVIIKGRIMCTPFGRWSVGREFNRRVKSRFAELGIEMPPGSAPGEQRLIIDQPFLVQQVPPAAPQ